MAGKSFNRVSAGDGLKISAGTWNALLESAEAYDQDRVKQGVTVPTVHHEDHILLVLVKNVSGADVDQFCPLEVTGSVFNPGGELDQELASFKTTPVLNADAFGADSSKTLVITREPIKSNSIGYASLAGVVPCKVDVTNASHTHALPVEDDTDKLTSAMYGHRILYKESGTGEKWAYIRIEFDCPLAVVITTETISPNTYGGFRHTTGAKGSETAEGPTLQGFYRNEEADPPDLPSGTLCYRSEVPCDDLGDGETGWELTPIACIDA